MNLKKTNRFNKPKFSIYVTWYRLYIVQSFGLRLVAWYCIIFCNINRKIYPKIWTLNKNCYTVIKVKIKSIWNLFFFILCDVVHADFFVWNFPFYRKIKTSFVLITSFNYLHCDNFYMISNILTKFYCMELEAAIGLAVMYMTLWMTEQ